jgi:hypothetical protein
MRHEPIATFGGCMKKFTVYVPCIYSEFYQSVEANSEEEAIESVRNGKESCNGETVTGVEDEGFRAVEECES